MVEVLDAPSSQNAGQRGWVSKGIWLEINAHILWREAKLLLEILAGIKQVAADAFSTGHVLVALDPLTGCHFPATLLHALADRLKHRGVVCLDQVIGRSLALRVDKVWELVH